jgi:hypothetical protein
MIFKCLLVSFGLFVFLFIPHSELSRTQSAPLAPPTLPRGAPQRLATLSQWFSITRGVLSIGRHLTLQNTISAARAHREETTAGSGIFPPPRGLLLLRQQFRVHTATRESELTVILAQCRGSSVSATLLNTAPCCLAGEICNIYLSQKSFKQTLFMFSYFFLFLLP